MTTKNIYLLNPYIDVIKVNINSDSVFKIKLNGAIHYTLSEIVDKINSIPEIGDSEDQVSKICRWLSSLNANIKDRQRAVIDSGSPLINVNTFSDNVCGGISQFVYQTISLFKPEHYCHVIGGGIANVVAHQWNAFEDGHFDQINKSPTYKGKYIGASVEEIKADKTLYTEPIRINWNGHRDSFSYNGLIYGISDGYPDGQDVQRQSILEILSTFNNLQMKMPSGSSLVFPVKLSVPMVEEYLGYTMLAPAAAMQCSFPTGVVGIVEMPCNVYTITGTGTVKIDNITYTLPTDVTALNTALQVTVASSAQTSLISNFHNSFEILTNTGGLSCEFLVNRKTWLLFHDNIIEYDITSGSISFERAKTAAPLDTIIMSVDKGLSPSFTLNFDRWFTKSKSFRLPKPHNAWDQRGTFFSKDSNGKQPIPQWWNFYTKDGLKAITAGAPVVDQCFCSRLTPKDETFATTLELSFTSVDESSCYYTLDDTTPDGTKTLYSAPFTISATTTVKWINIKADYANSHVNTRVITKV